MIKTSYQTFLAFLVFILQCTNCEADVNSGCPFWGCLSWGSFSLSAGIPSENCSVVWRVAIEELPSNSSLSQVPRGCVSDQQTVVCTTESGYISIDPTNGKKLWNYTTMSSPYLPIMDIYGDVIGMDVKALYYVGADGAPKKPIGIGILKPGHSLMVSNNSIMFLTASTNKTSQVFTYDTDGIIDGALPLTGTIERTDGTFIPFSQPIIAGFRAYVMTYFLPNEPGTETADKVTGMLRLYGIDLLHQLAPRIKIAWYFNFGKCTRSKMWTVSTQSGLEPIVTYYDGTIYINVPQGLEHIKSEKDQLNQPWPGTLWGIRDDGNDASLVFRTSSLYGPMAVYDTYDKPLSKDTSRNDEQHLVWVMNRSPPIIQGRDSLTGKIANISGFDLIFEKISGWITSYLTITRSNNAPNNDQLVFGAMDNTGQASINVIEVDNGQAKLVLSRIVSKAGEGSARVEGQIVNFAFYPPTDNNFKSYEDGKDTWKLGLAALVTCTNSTYTSRSVVGIF